MRIHFDPGFSHLASMNLIPTFTSEITNWVVNYLPSNSNTAGKFIRQATQACRYLPFRLIALTIYGDALDAKVTSLLYI